MRRLAVWPARLVLAALLAAALSCGDVVGPLAGSMTVRLEGPVAVRSAQLRLIGAQTSVRPGPGTGFAVFTASGGGDTLLVAVVAPVGHTLSEGALVSVQVPDARRVSVYRVRLLEVAAADYS
ncbi:MAG TPA: hypothetical protein VLV15_13055, partial [Dongiaceae bacterium]|nr:hypothetical protein [Dongiaceae bacterium]